MSRRQQWTPYSVAGIRDNLARGLGELATEAGQDSAHARAAGRTVLADEFTGHAAHLQRCTDAAHDAELFWVASDMADVALDASHDMPGLIEQDVHWPHGLMLFEAPLPTQITSSIAETLRNDSLGVGFPDAWTEPAPVDGLLWFPDADGIRIEVLVRATNLSGVLRRPGMTLTAYASSLLPLPADFTEDATFLDGTAAAPEGRDLGVTAFLAATWHLMSMPAVARARDIQPKTGEGRPAESVTVPAGQVRVVDARPMKTVPSDETTTTGEARQHSNRWVVRGHWRQQAHGPGRSQRRTQWIESYIKGPEDAPLAPHTLVRAWRR